MRFIHISIAQALVFSALAMHMYVWNLGSQKKSWFQMVSVSDGVGTLARWHVGSGPGGFVLCSVFCLFRLLQKCRGELQALAMPICIARPKVGGVSGPTSCTSFTCNSLAPKHLPLWVWRYKWA